MELFKILEGNVNLLKAALNIADYNIEALAEKRIKICKVCPYVSRFKIRCTICTCPIEAKTRVLTEQCADKENRRW